MIGSSEKLIFMIFVGVAIAEVQKTKIYDLQRTPMTQNEARVSCSRNKMKLAQPKTAAENSALATYLRSLNLESVVIGWIDLTYRDSKWQWGDGSEAVYTEWMRVTPTDSNREDKNSALFAVYPDRQGWVFTRGGSSLESICETYQIVKTGRFEKAADKKASTLRSMRPVLRIVSTLHCAVICQETTNCRSFVVSTYLNNHQCYIYDTRSPNLIDAKESVFYQLQN